MNRLLSQSSSSAISVSSKASSQVPDNCICPRSYYDRKPKLKLETETTNKAYYKPQPLQKPEKFDIPKVRQTHYDQSVLQSSYKNQYTAPPKDQSSKQTYLDSKHLSENYMKSKPRISLSSETQYKKTFVKNEIKPEKVPEYQYKPNNVKFQGQSSYKAQFNPPKNSGSDLAKVGQSIISSKQYMARKPQIPFQGSSAYKQTFTKHEIKAEKAPEYKYKKNDVKFEGQSSYKDTFQAPPKQALKSDLYCPVHPDKMAIQ